MKYMISCKHALVQLQKADEIRVDYDDIGRLADFITEEWKCLADIIIYIPKDQVIDWNLINIYRDLLNITLAFEDAFSFSDAKNRGYKYFWSFPITSWFELQGLLDLGVSQVLLDAPLYFELPKVKAACGDTEIRLVANKCFNNYMPRRSGICGTYIRPEDVDEYAKYIDHIEFIAESLTKEETLLKIYKYDKSWPGNLNILLTYLVENVDNRGFDALDEENPKLFAQNRIECGQRCQENPARCRFCTNAFRLINTIDRNKEWIKEQSESRKE